MKKLIFSLIAVLTLSIGSMNAQVIKETVEPFQKSRQPAFSMSLDYPKYIVEEALKGRLKQDKLKGKSSSGFMEYIEVEYPTLCYSTCSFYTKVVGNKKSATIYLFISKDSDRFISSGDDSETAENAKEFLKSLINDVKSHTLKIDIEEQDKILSKAEKDYSKLINDQEKLAKDQKKLEKEIKDAQKNVSTQKGIFDKLKEKQAKIK